MTQLTQTIVALLAALLTAQAVREYTRSKAKQPKPEPAQHDKPRKVA